MKNGTTEPGSWVTWSAAGTNATEPSSIGRGRVPAELQAPRVPIANGSAACRFWSVPERRADPLPGILRLARKPVVAQVAAIRLRSQDQECEEHELAHFFGEAWVCGHGSRVERVALRTGSSARCARWESELTMHGTSVAGALGARGTR